MSRFQFEIMTVAQAIELLSMKTHQADLYADRVRAVHRLMPKTTPAEREASRAFILAPTSLPCAGCGKFAFARPTICFWCTLAMRT